MLCLTQDNQAEVIAKMVKDNPQLSLTISALCSPVKLVLPKENPGAGILGKRPHRLAFGDGNPVLVGADS